MPTYTLTIKSLDSYDVNNTPDRRLALLLKRTLRIHGFRCISAKELDPLPEPEKAKEQAKVVRQHKLKRKRKWVAEYD